MKANRLSSILLSAAICALCLTGCTEESEVPIESSDAGAVSSVSDSVSTSKEETSEPSYGASTNSASSNNTSSSTLPNGTSTSISSSSSANEQPNPNPTQSSASQSESSSSSSAHTHTYVSKTVAPTCAELGYTVHTCSCGDQYTTDTVEALGHDYSKNIIQPTCTASGYTQYNCDRCGYKYKDNYTNALGHKYAAQTVNATCDHGGYTLHTCERCGNEYRDGHTHHHGHSWGSWTVTKEPTAYSEGEQQRECSRCGETSTQAIPRLEADLSSYAEEVIRLVNTERAKRGLSALSARNDLTEYAQLRSTEIANNFSHTRPDGSNPLKYVMGLNGIHAAGENIAAGYSSPESVMNGWMNSEGHRNNILSPNYTMIGVGCYKSGDSLYWTQIFGG